MKIFLPICLLSYALTSSAQEAFEVGPKATDKLPGGKEADGIIGDFVLRNDVVEAVISSDRPLRRANMSTFYGAGGITPGCLFDLTLRGKNNDQLTLFGPHGQRGDVSHVRITEAGKTGAATIQVVVSAASNDGLAKRHEYRIDSVMQGVLITTTYHNQSGQDRKGAIDDYVKPVGRGGKFNNIRWIDAVDPADKCGYAIGWLEGDGGRGSKLIPAPRTVTLKPGEKKSYTRYLAVGSSPAEAVGEVLSYSLVAGTGMLTGTITGKGQPIPDATALIKLGKEQSMPAYPDEQGKFSVHLPPGNYGVEVTARGRETFQAMVTVKDDVNLTRINPNLGPASGVQFAVTNEAGNSIPCKAQFIGIEDTQTPNLGPQNRAHGCVDQWHSERGEFFVALDPGKYKIIVTRGIEHSHLERGIVVKAGETVALEGTLKRLVKTPGWVSTDFHNHSTPSGDNQCGTDDRIINLAAEHIEFAPATEHNRIYDWAPHIRKLGLANEIGTIIGMELTGAGAGSHFNCFPLTPKTFIQDHGAPAHQNDPRLNAITLRDWGGPRADRWLHINHPDMVEKFIDRNADGRPDGGYAGFENLIDGLETQNYGTSQILSGVPYRIQKRGGREYVRQNREFIWLQLLNRGHGYHAIAVCDAHSVYGNGVGGWRTYVKSNTDIPAKIDWREISRNAKAGRMILTTGPFLEVSTQDGAIAGGYTRLNNEVELHVRVQCTDWIDIDRVQVLINGRQYPALNFTRTTHKDLFGEGVVKFDQKLRIPLSEDSHLIVVAYGENHDLKKGYGTSTQSSIKPCAYNNPIFVDIDGNGFKPNGDNLNWPLPVNGLTVETVKAMLAGRKIENK
jgi:hypothetical protein